MALYPYSCKTCHDYFERRVNHQARDAQTCYVCGHPLRRRYAVPFVAAVKGIPNRIGNEIEDQAEKLQPEANFTL